MKPGTEAIIITIGEPQFDKCYEAANAQTLPFKRVSIIKDVSPLHKAYNKAMGILECENAVFIDADMILNPDAHEVMSKMVGLTRRSYVHLFGLWDSFLKMRICGLKYYGSEALKKYPWEPVARPDVDAKDMARGQGYIVRDLTASVEVGTHFADPDNFQIFRRFYARGQKCRILEAGLCSRMVTKLYKLKERETDDRYKIATKSFKLGLHSQDEEWTQDYKKEEIIFSEMMEGVV